MFEAHPDNTFQFREAMIIILFIILAQSPTPLLSLSLSLYLSLSLFLYLSFFLSIYLSLFLPQVKMSTILFSKALSLHCSLLPNKRRIEFGNTNQDEQFKWHSLPIPVTLPIGIIYSYGINNSYDNQYLRHYQLA